MIKNAARVIALAAFLFAPPFIGAAHAQEEIKGIFYSDCFPSDGPAVTIELENYMRLTLYGDPVEADDDYRTKAQVMENESETLHIGMCTQTLGDCKFVEGLLTTYEADAQTVRGALEYFDGTETQGDSESVQGPVVYFTATRDATRPPPKCN